MHEITRKVFITDSYPVLTTGLVVSDGLGLVVDCPYREEDVKEWIEALSEHADIKYFSLTDQHPERMIGARHISKPVIAHDNTRVRQVHSPDTYKGNASPIGSEIDRLKRVTGMSRSIPDLTFSAEMELKMGSLTILFEYHPGPMSSSMWIVIPEREVVFIGDAVPTDEPPFLSDSDIDLWLQALDDLREPRFRDYRLVSARNGLIERTQINDAARFLRKVRDRIAKIGEEKEPMLHVEDIAMELADEFKSTEENRALYNLRMEVGLSALLQRSLEPEESES